MTRRRPLRPFTVCALALAASTLFGCSPAPTPTPTPSPTAAFASEEEAFAAAEETYRAYNDALNTERSASTKDLSRTYLTGAAIESDLSTRRMLDEQGLVLKGDGKVLSFEGQEVDLSSTPVTASALVCMDVSETRVLNKAGEDVTPSERPNRVELAITFVSSATHFLISESSASAGSEC